MNTDRARSQLGPVQHHVIGKGANLAKRRFGIVHRIDVRFELGHVFLMQRSEWMMRRLPALLSFVPLEHGEIRNPEKTKIFFGVAGLLEALMLGRILLSQIQPQKSALFAEMLEALVHDRSIFFATSRPSQQPEIVWFDGGVTHDLV